MTAPSSRGLLSIRKPIPSVPLVFRAFEIVLLSVLVPAAISLLPGESSFLEIFLREIHTFRVLERALTFVSTVLHVTHIHDLCASCNTWVCGFALTAVLQMGLRGTCALTSSLSSSSWFVFLAAGLGVGESHGHLPHCTFDTDLWPVLAQVPRLAILGAAGCLP